MNASLASSRSSAVRSVASASMPMSWQRSNTVLRVMPSSRLSPGVSALPSRTIQTLKPGPSVR